MEVVIVQVKNPCMILWNKNMNSWERGHYVKTLKLYLLNRSLAPHKNIPSRVAVNTNKKNYLIVIYVHSMYSTNRGIHKIEHSKKKLKIFVAIVPLEIYRKVCCKHMTESRLKVSHISSLWSQKRDTRAT